MKNFIETSFETPKKALAALGAVVAMGTGEGCVNDYIDRPDVGAPSVVDAQNQGNNDNGSGNADNGSTGGNVDNGTNPNTDTGSTGTVDNGNTGSSDNGPSIKPVFPDSETIDCNDKAALAGITFPIALNFLADKPHVITRVLFSDPTAIKTMTGKTYEDKLGDEEVPDNIKFRPGANEGVLVLRNIRGGTINVLAEKGSADEFETKNIATAAIKERAKGKTELAVYLADTGFEFMGETDPNANPNPAPGEKSDYYFNYGKNGENAIRISVIGNTVEASDKGKNGAYPARIYMKKNGTVFIIIETPICTDATQAMLETREELKVAYVGNQNESLFAKEEGGQESI